MKKVMIIICILIAILFLIPIPVKMKEGGTVHYNAILYDIYDVHRINLVDPPSDSETYETEYIEGIIVEIFGFEVFNNTNPHIDN